MRQPKPSQNGANVCVYSFSRALASPFYSPLSSLCVSLFMASPRLCRCHRPTRPRITRRAPCTRSSVAPAACAAASSGDFVAAPKTKRSDKICKVIESGECQSAKWVAAEAQMDQKLKTEIRTAVGGIVDMIFNLCSSSGETTCQQRTEAHVCTQRRTQEFNSK